MYDYVFIVYKMVYTTLSFLFILLDAVVVHVRLCIVYKGYVQLFPLLLFRFLRLGYDLTSLMLPLRPQLTGWRLTNAPKAPR